MTTRTLAAILFAAIALCLPVGAARAAEDTILVLDASGSMWGQIDEEAKIAIAKRVLGEALADIPADRRLGLIAYGHRKKGDCADIEVIAPVGTDRKAIAAAVAKLNPKGKTPMSDAVKLAAEKLRYTEDAATVILISDGIETCEPDPCGVAAALEAAGADLTVHVIGFDVSEENAQAQLRCIAENTGGTFAPASSAAELGKALATTVVGEPAVEPEQKLYLRATELAGGLLIEKGLTWTVTPAGGGEPVVARRDAGRVDVVVPPGTYDVRVERPSDGLKGEQKDVVVQRSASKTVTIPLTFPVSATVRAEPSGSAVAGSSIAVHWTGPDRRGDFVSIAAKDAGDGEYESYNYVRVGNPVQVRLPLEPGSYEVRYVLGKPYRVLARADIAVTAATATLDAPPTVLAGEEVAVAFTGPPPGSSDYVTVTTPDAPGEKYSAYAYTRSGSPAKLRMPLAPGSYEIRLVQGGKKVLTRRPIQVAEAAATISGKETAVAGETVDVAFTGPPAGSGDYITVTTPDAPESRYGSYAYAKSGSPAKVRMPLGAGAYELRYIQGGQKVIARQPITVTEAKATLLAPGSAPAGSLVDVEFTGPPAGSGDYVVVSEKGSPDLKYVTYAYTKTGSPAKLRMPKEPGDYELRFIQGSEKLLARRPIAVTTPVD